MLKNILNTICIFIILSIISILIIDFITSNPLKLAIAQIESFKTSDDLSTFSNSTYGTKIKYPSSWSIDEIDESPDDRTTNVATIWSPLETHKDEWQDSIAIRIDPISYNANLQEYLDETIEIYNENENFELIESTTNSKLAGHPAYSLVYTYTHTQENEEGDEENFDIKAMEIGTIIDNKAYYLLYTAENESYSEYLDIIQNMINSFEITNIEFQPLKYGYDTLGLEISYPPEWKLTEIEGPSLVLYPNENLPVAVTLSAIQIPSIENSFQNEATLTDSMNNIINNIQEDISITNFQLINSQLITLNGYPGFKIEYTYTDQSKENFHEFDVYTAKGNTLYSITYNAIPAEYQTYLSPATDIINSFHILNPNASGIQSLTQAPTEESISVPTKENQPLQREIQTNNMTRTNQEFSTYEDSFGMKMQYPITWVKNEDIGNTNTVYFTHQDGISLFSIDVFNYETPLNEIIANVLSNYNTNVTDFTPIESKPVTIAGSNNDAHMLVYSYSDPQLGTMQAMEVFVVNNNNNLLYNFLYDTQIAKYSTHLPIVLNIVKSIEFENVPASNDAPQQQLSPPAQLTPF